MSNVGTDLYFMGGTSDNYANYRYNTVTNTLTQETNMPIGIGSTAPIISVGTNIYIFGGYSEYTKVRKYIAANKIYETDNSVIIQSGTLYTTELLNTDFEENYGLKNSFADAWFYTTQDGLITDIPTYYGDGTQWINIKNPPPYTELEYIESTGTQYINTNYLPNANTGIEVDFQFTDLSAQQRLYGTQTSTSNETTSTWVYYINSKTKWAYAHIDGVGNWINTNYDANDRKHNLKFNVISGKIIIDDGAYNADIVGTVTQPSARPLYIMASNIKENADYKGQVRIYEFKIYENNTLVRDFIPVKDENDVVCLYDTVTETYFYNQGTGTFIAGAEK